MTYDELRALALQVEDTGDNLFRESTVVAKTGLESAILENKIDKQLLILKEKMNKSYLDSEDVFFFHESINRCLTGIDEFINDTVARVPLYRENKVNAFFKSVYLYLRAIWGKIKEAFMKFVNKFRKSKPYKQGEKVKPDKDVEKEVNAKFKKAIDESEFINDDNIDELFEASIDKTGMTEQQVKEMMGDVSSNQKKTGEVVFAKNIYEKVYASDADMDAKRLVLAELMETYDLKKLSRMLIDYIKSSPLLGTELAKYRRVLKMCVDSDDMTDARIVMGNMLFALAKFEMFSDDTTHKVNFFDVEIARLDHASKKAGRKHDGGGEYSVQRAIDKVFGDVEDNGDVIYDLIDVIEHLSTAVKNGADDYIKPLRLPIHYREGLFKTRPDEDVTNKWYSMCQGLRDVDLNQWYGNQLGMFKSVNDEFSKYNKVATARTKSIMANELPNNKAVLADVRADISWGDIIRDLVGAENLKNLAPSKKETISKSKVDTKYSSFDLFSKAVTYSELLNIIQSTDPKMYDRVPHTLALLVSEGKGGLDTSKLDETIKRATTLFQVRLSDEEAVGADVAKRVKESITIRTSATKEFMQALSNFMSISEIRRNEYRQVLTTLLEVYVADIGVKQFGVLTVIEHILSDKFLLESAVKEIAGTLGS